MRTTLRILSVALPPLLSVAGTVAAAAADPAVPLIRHDPFSRPALERAAGNTAGNVAGDRPTLKGVLTNGDLRLANVDGRILTTGERVQGYLVLSITDRTVTLQHGEDMLTLELNGAESRDGEAD